jgi:two-component system, cell cycle sensor histidine kinase and response regulator CckA
MSTLTARLLPFARELQRAVTFDDLLSITRDEVRAAIGYRHAWLFVADKDDFTEVRLLNATGDKAADVWEHAPVLTITGDAMLEEVARGDVPVVVADARTDPRTNKEMVAQLGNRTIINLPLRLLDKPLGTLGTGTFGDEEGVRPPTDEELDYLVALSAQLAVAAGRIRMLEERRLAESRQRDLEQQLIRAQRLESVAVLAGGLAHDFNNLLTVIIAGVGLARQHEELAVEELDAIEEAARRGHQLTRQLLAVSRAQPLSPRPVDLNGLLRKLLKLVQHVVPGSVHVELVEQATDPAVLADPSMLDQVFLNLCVNARDAMPEGGRLTITIAEEPDLASGSPSAGAPPAAVAPSAAQPADGDDRQVVITVSDTGVGMPPEVLDRLFEPFFTTKAASAGTGLGLAVAYGIVHQHGGTMTCVSEPGAGTTFTIRLPRVTGSEGEPAPGVTPLVVEAPRVTGRALLVEDDPDVRIIGTRVLQLAGYEVTPVADGELAVERAAAEPFDVAVLDVVLPGISGIEALERIQERHPEMSFVLVSGYSPSSLSLERFGREGIEFCEKPYRPDDLLASVGRAMSRRQPAG